MTDAETEKRRPAAAQEQSGAAAPDAAALADAYRFFNEINIIAQLSSNQMSQRMPHGLNLSQFGVLNWFVRVDDEATPGRLARAFQVSKGAMTNTLSKLEAKGFVRVAPDPASGRRKLVRLTPRGRAARNDAVAAASPVLEEFLAHFRIGALRRQLPLLERVRRHLDAARDDPSGTNRAGPGSLPAGPALPDAPDPADEQGL